MRSTSTPPVAPPDAAPAPGNETLAPETPRPARGAVRAPRGREISCKGWQQEAALRMLMNNLDPEVAERPEDLVVYGGIGKAARNWECFDQIVAIGGGRRGTNVHIAPADLIGATKATLVDVTTSEPTSTP